MMRSLFSGVSGLTTNMLRMDVIGSNVANVNTVGFKTSRVTFQEAMSQTLQGASSPSGSLGGTNPTQVGTGAQLGAIDGVFSQGSLESTGINTDLAIQGRAFFLLSDGTTPVYTRAGSFQLDGNGQLVVPGAGYALQGYACDRVTGEYAALPSSIRLPVGQVEPARATSEMRVRGNLDADSEARGVRAQSGVMYAADGSPAIDATTLDDLKGDASGAADLLSAGDTISFSAMVGRSPVSGSLTVGATTTLGDLTSAIETALNSVPDITGLTAAIDADGRIQISTPDDLGEAGNVSGLVIQAQDGNSVARDDFNGVASITTTQTARDAGVFVDESTIYDSLGFTHTLRMEFQRVLGANQFSWRASVDAGETPVLSGGSGKVNFNADGSVNGFFYDQEGNTLPSAISIGPTTGAGSPMEISIDPGETGSFAGMTMTRGAATLDATGNGFGKGTAVDFSIDIDGTISTIFSNGVTRAVARVALAQFVNPAGLERAGDNIYQTSVNSGDATIGEAGGAIDATVNSGSLEQSNVDLAREFTNMILAQRGFQASARTITASDEVLNDLLNLRR